MTKTCNNCGTNEKKTPATVPYAVLEDFKETAKANSLKWFIFSMTILILFVGSNIFWIWKNSRYEKVQEVTEETYEIEANDSGNAVYNDDGSVVIGEDNS